MTHSSIFAKVSAALETGDVSTADALLNELSISELTPTSTKLFELLRKRVDQSLPQPSDKSNKENLAHNRVQCGWLKFYPDSTGSRQAEGGLRLRGSFKRNEIGAPLVTVITVVYNNRETIGQCIQSVLNQSYKNIEYIVIDGNSTDGTLDEILHFEPQIDYFVSEPDQGIYNAMNKGLALAKGDYIIFVNADDFFLTTAIEDSLKNIAENRLDLSYSGFSYMKDDGFAALYDEGRAWDESMLVQGIPGGHETILAHKDCYNLIGGYDETFKIAADYDWVMRAFQAGFHARRLDKQTLVMRMGGASFAEDMERHENYRLFQKHFGELPAETLGRLYQLKYYKNWFAAISNETELLELLETVTDNPTLHKALYLTMQTRKMNPQSVIVPAESSQPGKLKIAIALSFMTDASGGAERIAAEAANELARRGHAVTFVACHGKAGEPYYQLDSAIPYMDLGIHPLKDYYYRAGESLEIDVSNLLGRQYEKLNHDPCEVELVDWMNSGHLWRSKMFHGFFKQHEFDVVISHMPSTFPYALFGRPEDDTTLHIAALHNSPDFKFYSPDYPADNDTDRYMRLVSLERADKITVLFDEYSEQLPSDFQDKAFTLPNFSSAGANQPEDRERSSKIIVNVGRLTAQKGQDTLIRAFAEIKKDYPDWHLHVYGSGPLQAQLIELAQQLGLNAEEIFRGTTREISKVYQEAEIFAFPSLFEGFPLTLLEAMKSELPCVGFATCEGVKYLIEPDQTGLLVEDDDRSKRLESGLRTLIENEETRSRLGKNARHSALQYTLDKHVDILESQFPDPRDGQSTMPIGGSIDSGAAIDCAIFTSYIEGGAGIAADRLREGLSREGVQSRIYTYSDPSHEAHFRSQMSASMIQQLEQLSFVGSDANVVAGNTKFSASYPGHSANYLKFLEYADVINLHWVNDLLSIDSVEAILALRKPVVWTLHDMNAFTGGCHYSNGCENYKTNCQACPQLHDDQNGYPAKILHEKIRAWGDRIVIVTPSHWLAEEAKKSRVFGNSRVEVIANALDTHLFVPRNSNEVRRELGLPLDRILLLFTCQSHSERRKGFAELLDAARQLKNTPGQFHVVTLGHAHADLSELQLPHSSLGHISDQNQMAKIYSAADVTVLPSLEDNLPNVILESAACGTPVVAFDSGGIRDAVVNGVTGLTVAPGDTRALSEAIVQASESKTQFDCRDFAVKNFDLSIQAGRYKHLFEELLKSKRQLAAE